MKMNDIITKFSPTRFFSQCGSLILLEYVINLQFYIWYMRIYKSNRKLFKSNNLKYYVLIRFYRSKNLHNKFENDNNIDKART